MQQTKNHKFNLIEPTDTFSPEPLNQNMETLEQALGGLSGRNDAGDARTTALVTRVTALEAHRLATGSFTGIDGERTICLGFAPKFVIICDSHFTCLLVPGVTFLIGSSKTAEIREDGFFIYGSTSNPFRNGEHAYLAYA